MQRRDFIRRGALWTLGALVVEQPLKRLWAFPTNPLGPVRPITSVPITLPTGLTLRDDGLLELRYADGTSKFERIPRSPGGFFEIRPGLVNTEGRVIQLAENQHSMSEQKHMRRGITFNHASSDFDLYARPNSGAKYAATFKLRDYGA